MFRRCLLVLSLLALVGAFGCTTIGPSIAFSGLPAAITHGGTYTLTLTGSPGSSAGLWTYTLSSTCGGTFTSTTTPNNGPANPITIGPTNASTVPVSFAVTNPKADLSVTKSDNPDPVGVGYELTYTLTVGNVGTCTVTAKLTTASGRQATTSQNTGVSAANVLLTDTLPNPVTFGSATPSQGTCTVSFPTVTCDLGTIANGGSATVTIKVTPQAAAVPSITNTASVTGAITDSNAANDSDSEDTTVTPVADLSVAKSDNPDPVTYGQNVTYTVTVTNNGPSAATNVTLTDTLPTNMTFQSATGTGWTCNYNAGVVTCTRASLPVGAAPDITIVAQAKAFGVDLVVDDDTGTCAYTGTVTDTASVTADEYDPNTANNSASADTTINKNYSTISAAITAAAPGDTIFVCPGTYNENPNVNKALTITGAGAASTTINGTAAGNVVTISSSNVTLQGFTITAPSSTSSRYGIALATSAISTITIANNVIQNLVTTATYSIGISIHALNTNVTVTNNQITNIASGVLAYGVLIWGSGGSGTNNITIQGNQVSGVQGQTQAGIGISVNDTAGGVIVSGNTVSNLTSPGAGVRVVGIGTGGTAGTPNNITIQNNTVSNLSWTGANIQDAVGIGVGDTAQNVTIDNNTVTNCGVGIGLSTSGQNIQIVNGNDILNNQVGIGIGATPQAGWKANNNDIYNNVLFGVNNLTATLFDAKNNWWGCAAGPGNPGCDAVSANVVFTPWLTGPVD